MPMNSKKHFGGDFDKHARRHANNHHQNKIPPFRPDPEHWTRKSSHGWKAKVAYETEDDACEYLNQSPKLKAFGYRAYQCKVCQKWHIGHYAE